MIGVGLIKIPKMLGMTGEIRHLSTYDHHLAVAILNAALGIPMLAEELNSLDQAWYQQYLSAGDLNVLDYNRDIRYSVHVHSELGEI